MQECIESNDFKLSEEQWSHIDEIIDTYGNKPGGLIPMLEKIQFYLGFLPVPVQERISEKTGIPESKIYGVVSFYSFFTMTPRGRHRIQVCMGTACYVKGGKKIVEESTEDKRFTFETARCFGACGLAPVMIIDDKVYGKVQVEDLDKILSEYK